MTRTITTLFPELEHLRTSEMDAGDLLLATACYELDRLAAAADTARDRARGELDAAAPSQTFAVDYMSDYVAAATLHYELAHLLGLRESQGYALGDVAAAVRTGTLRSLTYTTPTPGVASGRIRLAQALGLLQ